MKYINKSIFLLIFILCTSIHPFFFHNHRYITDKLGISSIRVKKIIAPRSIKELQEVVKENTTPISIAGGCYSQGGQIGYPHGLVIDMKHLNTILDFNEDEKTITVQAGATWYDVQKYIDPYNLSIKAMQSYNNFSIGGSLSVNAHGRDIQYGSVINGIRSIQMMLANGTIITADRQNNSDLFTGAIGGYGLLGIITQATIELTENSVLENKIQACTIDDFQNILSESIITDPTVVFYNAILFPKLYHNGLVTTWHTSTKSVTDKNRLKDQNSPFYFIDKAREIFVKYMPLAWASRELVEKKQVQNHTKHVVWRNNEMSYSTHQLALDYHFPTTMTLQEYFVPIKHAQAFAKKMTAILKRKWINVLNISIRYVKADTTSIMTYAPKDSCAFVLYIHMFNNRWSIKKQCIWTQQIINAALEYGGTYYLPYIMCAKKDQFKKAYPHFEKLLHLKKIYDPSNKFRNMLFHTYAEK